MTLLALAAPRARFPAVAVLAVACVLQGCGGGGGGDTSPPPADPTPPPPPAPAPTSFTLSGALLTPGGQNLDGDTNDPNNTLLSNDDITSAQPIGNPTTLGGYVNEAGTGEEGRSQLDGDPEDYFAVDLVAGQRISLLVADFQTADADLYLYNDSGDLVDFSLSVGELEEVSVDTAGRYFVNVSSFSGATNYTLAVGLSPSPAGAAPQPQVVPWELVVEYEGEARPDIPRRLGARRLGGGERRAQLLQLRRDMQDILVRQRRLGRQAYRRGAIVDAALAAQWETRLAAKHAAREPGVRRAEPNYRVRPLASVNDEAFATQWHYPLINVPGAWDTSTGNDGVVVAVIDTGVLAGHPDLQGQLLPGYDFVRDAEEAGDGDGIDPDPEETVGGGDPGAVNFHGTHVLGTVGARANNGIGVAGIAYSARVMPVRALAASGGTSYDVRQAVRYAAGLENDSGTVPDRPADIINLSLGGAGFSQISQDLYDELRGLGIAVVAAAGNESSRAPSYPAAYDGVIAVSAVDLERQITGYSNRGTSIDIAAPGGDGGRDLNGDGFPDGVLSTGATDGRFAYTFLSGTSMAAPHVAGVFALMKAVNPALDAATIEQLLIDGRLTEDIGEPGRDDLYGYGLIDARRAVDAALVASGQASQLPPRLSVSTAAMNFGTSRSSIGISLSNSGGGELDVIAVDSAQPWLSASAESTDANGLGRYSVNVDRGGLDPGIYEGEITARSSSNTVKVRVLAAVADSTDIELGVLYLVIYDPRSDETVAGGFVERSGSGYAYRVQSIDAGDYQIFAGTDLDNDQLICDAGEACGAYLTIEQPLTISVDADRGGLDFAVEYLIALPGETQGSDQRPGDGLRPPQGIRRHP